MKTKIFLTLIFVGFTLFASAQFVISPKELFATDKLLHASAGYVVGATSMVVADALGSKRPHLWGFIAVLSVAGGKELYDHVSGNGTVDVVDGLMTFNGGVLAVATVSIPIDLRKKRNLKEERRRRENFINNDLFSQ